MPSTSRLLLFTATPKADESLIGYLLRLTELNRLYTLSWMLQAARIKSYVQANLSFAFDHSVNLLPLSKLAGVDVSELPALLYSPVDQLRKPMGDYLMFGSPVPLYMIRVRYPKVCPACLREKNYARRIWELSPVTSCPIHKCLLLDECPKCEKRISWTRSKVSCCQCDFDWRECEIRTVDNSELIVSWQIYLRCKLPISEHVINRSAKDNPLYKLDLKNFLSALFFIGGQYAGLIDTKGKHLAPSTRSGEIHTLLHKAFSAFEDWPNNYFSFLDWRRAQVSETRPAGGISGDFAGYKSALYIQLASSHLDFMRTAFEGYLVTRWDGGYSAHLRRPGEAVRQNGKYASRREAKELLKVSVQSVDQLIVVGKLKAIVRKQGKARLILIERASLLEFKSQLDQSLFLKQVQGLLGLSHSRVLELVNCSLLNPLRGPAVDGCSDWRFSEKEVKDLIAKIKKTVRPRASTEAGGTVSFLMAFRKLRSAHISMGQFINDTLSGKVYPCEVSSKPGLDAFQFSKKLITEYMCKLTMNINEGEGFYFSAKELLNGKKENFCAN